MTPLRTLLLIIFLEGYVVLSSELLAIRLIIPYTGSGTDTISIIIAAVLMPLAFGYSSGGKFVVERGKNARAHTVRKQLLWNLTIAALFLTAGLSYLFLDWAYDALYRLTGINDRIVYTVIYSALFLVYPVFLLGQTVPLVSNFFRRQKLSSFAGKILFFSTMGSFAGAIFCTLVLMAFLGVHHAVTITIGCMFFIAILLSKKKTGHAPVIIGLCFLTSLVINSDAAMRYLKVIKNDHYSVIQVREYDQGAVRAMLVNRSTASIIHSYTDEPYFGYVMYVEDNFIAPTLDNPDIPPKDILILGAGGFMMGRRDQKNNYIFVDIDKHLKDISEKDFLKTDIDDNKEFVPLPARAYLNQTDQKFDLIMMDLFLDPTSTPEHLVTREFFQQVKDHLKTGGVVVGNYFGSPTFSDAYSRNLDATLRSVFPYMNRHTIQTFNGWKRDDNWANIAYSYIDVNDDGHIYTDNKNTSVYDRPSKLPPRAKAK